MMKKPSMSGWPNGAACGLDRDRLLDGFFVAGMRRRELFHLQNMHAEVADFAQGQPSELRDCLADLAKDILDRGNRVASANCLEQITQDFPIITCIPGWAHRAIQSLQSAFPVDHRAAFFGEAARGQNNRRFLSSLVRQNIHDDEYWELSELF